jgi:CRISPR-associated protein Cmr4
MTNAKAIYLHALTPVHSGTGQAVAVIDLPIAREKATGFPIIPASSLKGVLRDQFNGKDWVDDAFGTQDAGGAFTFTDMRILCLPVRSYYGTFAYVTCPLVLTRFHRDMKAFGLDTPFDGTPIPDVKDGTDSMKIALTNSSDLQQNNQVYLEDLDLDRDSNATQNTTDIAMGIAEKIFDTSEQQNFQKCFAIVSDATFSFLCETATEIAARITLEEGTKTVKQGQLWYEEAVPAESIFHGIVMMADHYKRNGVSLNNLTIEKAIQIGGNATVGRGLCRVVIK